MIPWIIFVAVVAAVIFFCLKAVVVALLVFLVVGFFFPTDKISFYSRGNIKERRQQKKDAKKLQKDEKEIGYLNEQFKSR